MDVEDVDDWKLKEGVTCLVIDSGCRILAVIGSLTPGEADGRRYCVLEADDKGDPFRLSSSNKFSLSSF
uniref:Uncharacterized protein n=1 Tax=Panagrolaimus superbus TaxID=310955 RepID=A0A914Z928_9BILA